MNAPTITPGTRVQFRNDGQYTECVYADHVGTAVASTCTVDGAINVECETCHITHITFTHYLTADVVESDGDYVAAWLTHDGDTIELAPMPTALAATNYATWVTSVYALPAPVGAITIFPA